MDAIRRFFHKYLLYSIGILALFFALNIVLVIGTLVLAGVNSTDPEIHIREIGENITLDSSGAITVNSDVSEVLSEKKAWAMILDNNGLVIWQEGLPTHLPRKYTATDIAKFSRWYLQNYPVYILEHDAGLLVIGCEPGSLQKIYYAIDSKYISTVLTGTGIAILANAVLMIFLFLRNVRKIEKSIVPILSGIETISQGKTVSLAEKGELAEINTKLNRAGKYIAQKDLARAEWINGISHDVRTPLSIMLGYADELENSTELSEEVRLKAGIIRQQGEKLRRLVSDLNLTSKLEYSMQPLHIETVYPLELARQVISEYLNNGVEEIYMFDLLSDPDAESLSIQGDVSLLTRLLDNLIGNSIRHNPMGCRITVSVMRQDSFCKICISDDGIGMNQKQLQAVNQDIFSRPPLKTTENTPHGFGLQISAQIVNAHKGTIYFECETPQGLSVTICFPLEQLI